MDALKSSTGTSLVPRPGRGVKQAHVDQAADAILARGERPTVERIRALLGTGSPNTLGPLIDNWYRTLSARVAGMHSANADAQGRAPTAAINAFNLLWDTALAEARTASQAELVTERERLAQAQAAVAEDQRVLEATRAALEQAAQASREHIRELEGQVAAGQQQLQRAQQEAARAAAAANEQAGQLRGQLAQAQHTFQELQEQLACSEAQRQREVEREVERGAANERRWLAEVDRARGEARASQEEARRAQQQREEGERTHQAAVQRLREAAEEREQALRRTHQADLERLQGRVAALTTDLSVRDAQLAQATGALQRAEAVEAGLRELAALAQARAEDLQRALEGERALVAGLRQQLEAGPESSRPRTSEPLGRGKGSKSKL